MSEFDDYRFIAIEQSKGQPIDVNIVSGGGGGGGSSVDRELVVSTYRVKTAFGGASVGDTVTSTQIIDVSGTPTTVAVIWRNQSTAADLGSAPSAANLELVGSQALTDAQLRASAVPVSLSGAVSLPTGAATEATLSDINTKTAALVSGRVPVDNSGVVQPVSGTVAVSNFPATQAVSAASLPLPAGAATQATSASIDSKLPALVGGLVPVDGSGVTQPISAASLPLPTGAATDSLQNSGNILISQINDKTPDLGQTDMTGSVPVVFADDQTALTVTTDGGQIALDSTLKNGSAVTTPKTAAKGATTAGLVTSANFSADIQSLHVSVVESAALSVNNFPASQAVTAAALPLPSGASTSALQTTGNTTLSTINGKIAALGQATMAASAPVTIASNQSALAVTLATAPLPTGAATETTLAAINTKTPALGSTSIANSTPVVVASDQAAGGVTATAVNTDLLTNVVSGWFDAAAYHSATFQVIGGAGITAGQVQFEQTNDTTNAAGGQILPVFESALLTTDPIVASTAIAANTSRIFEAPVTARFVRVRISVAFTGGNVQCAAVFSQLPYATTRLNVRQATAGNLNATVAGNLTTVTTVTSVTGAGLNQVNVVDVASAALTTTTATAALTQGNVQSSAVSVVVTVVTGTNPTLDVGIEESPDGGVNWYRVFDFPRITAAGTYVSPVLQHTGNRIRYVQTVTGTTPSFTRSVSRNSFSVPGVNLRSYKLLGLDPNTLNNATAAVYVDGRSTVNMVISSGAQTTAPAIQLEGSEDGLAWYALGSPVTTVASTQQALSVSGNLARFARTRVSTAGTGCTNNYVQIKAI